MKSKELIQLGYASGQARRAAAVAIQKAREAGMAMEEIRRRLRQLARAPEGFEGDPAFGALASLLVLEQAPDRHAVRAGDHAPLAQWGEGLDPESVQQMRMALRLPVSVRGALMPDAHVGYGVPIGGVLATRGAVIPYAVGVDIACRMKLTVLDLPPESVTREADRLRRAIEAETRFGVGAEFKQRRAHGVLDADWSVSPVTQRLKDKAWAQLGTSGSGNHFVEFGVLEVQRAEAGIAPGVYLALMSHSGSRGTGAEVCSHYSKIARNRCRDLQWEYQHLAWLGLDTDAGQEYWAAMELMGAYAAANHACIHRHIAQHLGAAVLLDLENHHNFAWIEEHGGERLVVHRKQPVAKRPFAYAVATPRVLTWISLPICRAGISGVAV